MGVKKKERKWWGTNQDSGLGLKEGFSTVISAFKCFPAQCERGSSV